MKDTSRKVVVIGAGHVGSHCAYKLVCQGDVEEIVFIDIDERKAAAHAWDIADACSFMPHPVKIGVGDYDDCRDADIVVLAVGPSRTEGQTRLDMMDNSMEIIKEVTGPLRNSGFEGILICITNPADIIAYYMWKYTGWPSHRVFSTGTSLDTARLRRVLSEEMGIDARSFSCFSMGEHGDSGMVPFSSVSVGSKPLGEVISEKPEKYGDLDFDHILKRTITAGDNVKNGKGCTEFGIGTALADIVKAVFHDEKRIIPVSTLLSGEYGQEKVFAGVPAVVGRNGIEEIVEIRLTDEEQVLFDRSCGIIREHISRAGTAE